jgi:hypothetical protein
VISAGLIHRIPSAIHRFQLEGIYQRTPNVSGMNCVGESDVNMW